MTGDREEKSDREGEGDRIERKRVTGKGRVTGDREENE